VNLFLKLEINPIVDLVGLLELLKLCQIESVLLQDKNYKLESQLKIYLLVAMSVEMDAMEDILNMLGNIGLKLELLLEICIMLLIGVNHILSLHVTTTSTVV
jgi:hypothetical protein